MAWQKLEGLVKKGTEEFDFVDFTCATLVVVTFVDFAALMVAAAAVAVAVAVDATDVDAIAYHISCSCSFHCHAVCSSHHGCHMSPYRHTKGKQTF